MWNNSRPALRGQTQEQLDERARYTEAMLDQDSRRHQKDGRGLNSRAHAQCRS